MENQKTERIWDKFLTERDKQVFSDSGYGARAGFGKKPALLIIDVNYNFCGDKSEPILESIKRYRNSCGEDAWDAIPHIQKLIAAARNNNLPIIYSTGTQRSDSWDRGGWAWKNARVSEDAAPPKNRENNREGNDIIDEISPEPQDIIIKKLKPSVFHGTNMMGFVNDLGADSLIMAGTTTSGCVRATVLDAFSLNLRVTLAEDACFDRSQASHAINLCDINAKYADVIATDEIVDYFNDLPDQAYNQPTS